MQSIDCHYNGYNFARRAVCSATGVSKASIAGSFGLTLAYEDGNRMNAFIRWPNSRCSVVVETRSIFGLSPYNNKKTAERRASCEPRLQFIRPGVAGQTFISFRSVARHRNFCPWNPPSALYYFCLSGSQFYFSSSSLPLQFCPAVVQVSRFRPACIPVTVRWNVTEV